MNFVECLALNACWAIKLLSEATDIETCLANYYPLNLHIMWFFSSFSLSFFLNFLWHWTVSNYNFLFAFSREKVSCVFYGVVRIVFNSYQPPQTHFQSFRKWLFNMNGYQNLRKSLIFCFFFSQLSHKTYEILKIKLNEHTDGK